MKKGIKIAAISLTALAVIAFAACKGKSGTAPKHGKGCPAGKLQIELAVHHLAECCKCLYMDLHARTCRGSRASAPVPQS